MTPVHAQVLAPLPTAQGGQVLGIGVPPVSPLQRIDRVLRDPLAATASRQLRINALLRNERRLVDVDAEGAPVLRGQFLAVGISPLARDAVQSAGFVVAPVPGTTTLPDLDFVILQDTRRRRATAALRVLRQAAPDVTFAYQHLYLPAGGDARDGDDPPSQRGAAGLRRIGLIDGGVDATAPALAHARIQHHGCATATASRHGTAVAARLVEGDDTALYAADLWCGGAVGGATSRLIEALGWMARERVPVINISLVGPDNPVLARAVAAMITRGHVLVSAVGNDGPAAPPLFPAMYAGVIGVAGVDAKDRVLPESGRGEQVDFSASGMLRDGQGVLRGTSFAAPVVARRAAQLVQDLHPDATGRVHRQLAREARDLGQPGRDPAYGEGLLTPGN